MSHGLSKISSLKILFYLLLCLLVFYAVFYSVASIVFALYSMDDFDGKIPFDFKHWIEFDECCGRLEMVNTLSMLVTFPICGAIFGCYIPRWVWDFSFTTTVIHLVLSCLVMLDVPKLWTWWLCLGLSCILMIGTGEGVWHLLERRRRNRLVVPESSTAEQTSYLHS